MVLLYLYKPYSYVLLLLHCALVIYLILFFSIHILFLYLPTLPRLHLVCFSSRSVNQAACSARGDTPFFYSRSALLHGMEGPAGFLTEESQSGISWRPTGVLWPPETRPPRFDVDSCGSLVREKEREAEEGRDKIDWNGQMKDEREDEKKTKRLTPPLPSSRLSVLFRLLTRN